MSGLSEAELHVQAMRLVCEALADREQQGIEVDWDVLRQMHDQMDAMLQDLWHKHRYDSSEMVDLRKDRDAARAEIETLRKELDDARAETVETRKRLNDETDRHRATHAEKIELFEQKWANQHNVELRGKLAAAHQTILMQRAGIERLQAFVEIMRGLLTAEYADQRIIAAAIAELDDANSSATLTSSPTPVAEPLDAEGGA